MINITKQSEPQELIVRRINVTKWNKAYKNTSKSCKIKIRESVCIEQGYLCAYCMCRITVSNTINEHWIPQSDPDMSKQLDYSNIIGSCSGNKDEHIVDPTDEIRCDHNKKAEYIKFNPADPQHDMNTLIYYQSDGTIKSTDSYFDDQLNDILNLNYSKLRRDRKDVLDEYLSVFNFEMIEDSDYINQDIIHWQSKDSKGRLEEYCGVITSYLRELLKEIA